MEKSTCNQKITIYTTKELGCKKREEEQRSYIQILLFGYLLQGRPCI